MVGFAIFGAAIVGVLVLVVRMGRSAAAPPVTPAPAAPPNRFGIGAPAPDHGAYAVSAVPAGVGVPTGSPSAPLPPLGFPPAPGAFPPPAGFAPPGPGFPPPGPGFPPPAGAAFPVPGAAFPAPPAWGQPFGGAPLPQAKPSGRGRTAAIAGAVVGLLGLLGVAYRVTPFVRNELNPLTAPSDLGGVPLANDHPMLAPMVKDVRAEVEREGARNPLVAAYTAPRQPLYMLLGARNQGYGSRAEAFADFADDATVTEGGARMVHSETVTTPRGTELDCFTMRSASASAVGCVWKVEDTAGLLMAFGAPGPGYTHVAGIMDEALDESGVN